jgi:hypothetical protein
MGTDRVKLIWTTDFFQLAGLENPFLASLIVL